MTSPELVILGSLTVDNVLTASGVALPPTYAGNVVYAAMGARVWMSSIGIVSRVGTGFSQVFLDRIAAAGVDIEGGRRVNAAHGMNCAFCYAADGSREREFSCEAMAQVPPAERGRFIDYTTLGIDHRYAVWHAFAPTAADIPDAWLDDAIAFHAAAMPVDRHVAIAEGIRQRNRFAYVQVDSPWYDARDLSRRYASRLFALIDRLLPSEADLLVPFGHCDWQTAVRALFADGLQATTFKLGSHGAVVVEQQPDHCVEIPVCPVDATDPTGAGDAFCGGFLAGWALCKDPVEAALRATVSASFAVEDVGIEGLSNASAEEADRRLESLRTHISKQH